MSTQDTVVGLTALSMYAEQAIANDDEGVDIVIRTDSNDTYTYKVRSNNSMILEDFILPTQTQWIDIIVRGRGKCFMEFEEVHYKSKRSVDESQFKIKAKVTNFLTRGIFPNLWGTTLGYDPTLIFFFPF